MIDDHHVADDARLVAVRGRIVEGDGRHQPGIGRIGDIDDAGAEAFLVGQVADIGVIAGDMNLSGAADIEMGEPSRPVCHRRSVTVVHFGSSPMGANGEAGRRSGTEFLADPPTLSKK